MKLLHIMRLVNRRDGIFHYLLSESYCHVFLSRKIKLDLGLKKWGQNVFLKCLKKIPVSQTVLKSSNRNLVAILAMHWPNLESAYRFLF